MDKKKSYASGVNIGSSSILVTFVLLCLVTFAALSFVSANADNKLAKQTSDRVEGYYTANNYAEERLKYIDLLLKDNFRDTNTKKEYFDNVNNGLFEAYGTVSITNEGDDVLLNYSTPIYVDNDTSNQSLNVTLKVIYPESANDEVFEIKQWETVTEYVEDVPGSEESGFLF